MSTSLLRMRQLQRVRLLGLQRQALARAMHDGSSLDCLIDSVVRCGRGGGAWRLYPATALDIQPVRAHSAIIGRVYK